MQPRQLLSELFLTGLAAVSQRNEFQHQVGLIARCPVAHRHRCSDDVGADYLFQPLRFGREHIEPGGAIGEK